MKRKLTCILPLLLALSCSTQQRKSVESTEESTVARPNIILFLVDDMGWQDTSVPFHSETTPFNRFYRTPNMERLAKEGIRFTQAYSAAVCSPTRTSILTGKNPARHGVTNWTLRKDQDSSGKTDRLKSPDWNLNGIQPDTPTLPRLLKEQGYRTILAGKAHFGAKGTPGENPENLGFDVNIAGHAAGAPGSYQGKNNYRKDPDGEPRIWDVPGLSTYHGKDVHLTEALTLEAIKEMELSVADDSPFYLYLTHYAVHTPIQPHEPYCTQYLERGANPVEAKYASMIEGMDQSLGMILDELEALGVAENTLILFTSDNGGLTVVARGKTPQGTGANTHNLPLREGKGSAYEGGTRVPLIVSWGKSNPDHPNQRLLPIQEGGTSHVPVICEDYFTTLCHVAGVKDLSERAPDIDGVDIRRAMVGDETFTRAGPLLFHYPHVWGPKGRGYQPHSAIRMGDWKAIYYYQIREWELYNLAEDLGEQTNLATTERNRLHQLASKMASTLSTMGAKYPRDRESGREERMIRP